MCMRTVMSLALLIFSFCSVGVSAQGTEKIYLSGQGKDHTVNWKFYCTAGRHCGKWTTIPVPSQWELQGFGTYNYGLDWKKDNIKLGQEKGVYKHRFSVPASWKGKTVHIVFDGSMTDTKVKINGKLAGPIHRGAFYEFKYNVSNLLHYGSKNLLQVTVSKVSANKSVNRAERQADYWIFGGIFRPVYLEAKPPQYIKRVAINAKADGAFFANVFTGGMGDATSVSGQIETLGGEEVGKVFTTTLDHKSDYQTLSTKLRHIKPWSSEFPNLYTVDFELKDSHGRIIHNIEKRFGFRTVELRKGDGVYVNGKKIRFRGVDYHSFWPSSGRTTSKALSIKDVKLMKDMNMNAVRLSHYPHSKYFYQVCDKLGLFVLDELAGWQDSYNTSIGTKLVKEMVTRDVNHPSVVMWDNGNEGGYNYDLDDDFSKWDPQHRPVIHPGDLFRDTNTYHYPAYNCCVDTVFNGNKVFFPTEFLHGLYDGGSGAGLQDFWSLMRSKPLSAGGFLWTYLDQCVERADKNNRLDCAGSNAPDGIVGPYRRKGGSFYAIKQIWSPVQIEENHISTQWDERIRVESHFFYTNLKQVQFDWKLVNYPGPFDKAIKAQTASQGRVASPDVGPQSSGVLQFNLPSGWRQADALELKATGPHGREIYQWTLPIHKPQHEVKEIVKGTSGKAHIKQTGSSYIMTSSNHLAVTLSKESGYINKIKKNGKSYSLDGGPVEAGGSSSLKTIKKDRNEVTASFSHDGYKVTYGLDGGWLKISYSYRPKGTRSYFGISFNYPEKNVEGIKWLGHGPDRVWKNRLAGMELGLWRKKNNTYPNDVTIRGYHWHLPKFDGYYADLHWAVLHTTEGPITMMVEAPHIYLGLFKPQFPPHSGYAKAKYPDGDLSFLHAISPIGTKYNHKPKELGPSGQPNMFNYGGFHSPAGKPEFRYHNTLWFYFGKK